MRQFFISKIVQGQFIIDNLRDCHHAKVVRLKKSNQIVVVYNCQRYLAEISNIIYNDRGLIIRIDGKIIGNLENPEKNYHITVFLAQNKKRTWEIAVEKLTELGVNNLVPFICHYDQGHEAISSKQYNRLKEIVKNAAEQSNRADYLTIDEQPISFKQFCTQADNFDCILFGNEKLVNQKSDLTIPNLKEAQKIAVVIGPAGGFHSTELNWLNQNAVGVKLAETILKSETAAITIVNMCYFLIKYYE